jgi:hypothetical protein
VAGRPDRLEGRRAVEQLLRAPAAEEGLEVAEAAALLVDGGGVLADLERGGVGAALGGGRPGARGVGLGHPLLQCHAGAVVGLGRGGGLGLDLGKTRLGGGEPRVEGGDPPSRAGGRGPGAVDLLLGREDPSRTGVGGGHGRGAGGEGAGQGQGERQPRGAGGRGAARHRGPFASEVSR